MSTNPAVIALTKAIMHLRTKALCADWARTTKHIIEGSDTPAGLAHSIIIALCIEFPADYTYVDRHAASVANRDAYMYVVIDLAQMYGAPDTTHAERIVREALLCSWEPRADHNFNIAEKVFGRHPSNDEVRALTQAYCDPKNARHRSAFGTYRLTMLAKTYGGENLKNEVASMIEATNPKPAPLNIWTPRRPDNGTPVLKHW